MAHDYEDIFSVDDLDDDELQRIVRQVLHENRSIDADDITVHVHDGQIVLAGRVGTEAEKRIAERVIEDRIGIANLQSQLIVDPLHRAESPEAIDEHLADEQAHESLLLGDRPSLNNDETRHLADDPEAELYGTIDRVESLERGVPWIPPESPTPEGTNGPGNEHDTRLDSP